MASSSSPSPSSSQNQGSEITLEEFFAFHNIDRQLFSRLVFNLGREPAEAMQAAAFWLWLERLNMAHYVNTILKYPDAILDAIFKETLLCLRVAETDVFASPNDPYDIPIILSIVGGERICLRYFHENRIRVLLEVGNLIQQVCLRAFQDLFQIMLSSRAIPLYNNFYYKQHLSKPSPPSATSGGNGGAGGNGLGGGGVGDSGLIGGSGTIPLYNNFYYNQHLSNPSPPGGTSGGKGGGGGGSGLIGDIGTIFQPPRPPPTPIYSGNYGQRVVFHHPTVRVGDVSVPLHDPFSMGLSQGASSGGGNHASSSNDVPLSHHPRTPTSNIPTLEDLAEMLRPMRLSDRPQEVEGIRGVVPVSERTIFLTFSKGYPISEIELRDFLDRSFGDIIEALYMQEVGENEQPLYARLVVRDLSAMEAVLNGRTKSKFSINGKHVWARKYVRKNANSPPSSPS